MHMLLSPIRVAAIERDLDYEADPVIILTLDSSNAFNSPNHEQFVSVLSEGRKIALPQDS
jgi:hypothetical protein